MPVDVSTPSQPSRVAELVAQMPKPNAQSGILSEADDEAVRKAAVELLRGGRATVVALVDMLVEPGEGKSDSQARHALHAMVMQSGQVGDEQRKSLAEALGSTLAREGKPPGVRAFVVRQLQLCGGPEAAKAIGPSLLDDKVFADAAMALETIRDGAAEQFRAALPKVTGRQRVAVIHGLGTLRDASSAEAIRQFASDPDRDTRLTAWWALANMGDAGSADLLLKTADDASAGYERVQATKACLLLAERLTAGRKADAVKLYRRLRDTRSEPSERYVRDAAERGLAM